MSLDISHISKHFNLIDELLFSCKKALGYKNDPKVVFASSCANYQNPLGKTGYYLPQEQKIVIYVTGRYIKDILRSLAHELVHHAQNERGEFENMGITEEGYAQKDDHLREMEREAYEKGNLAFRDWEDLKKRGGKMKKEELKETIRRAVRKALFENEDNPCWDGYEMVGTKMKDGKEVPNCVPKEGKELEEAEDVKNPGKYKLDKWDKDGDGVPNGADKAPKDGAVSEARGEDKSPKAKGRKVAFDPKDKQTTKGEKAAAKKVTKKSSRAQGKKQAQDLDEADMTDNSSHMKKQQGEVKDEKVKAANESIRWVPKEKEHLRENKKRLNDELVKWALGRKE